MTGANGKPTLANIRTYLKKLKSLVTLLSLFKDEETVEKLDVNKSMPCWPLPRKIRPRQNP